MHIDVCPGSEYVLEYHKQIQWQKSKNTVATKIVNYHVHVHFAFTYCKNVYILRVFVSVT